MKLSSSLSSLRLQCVALVTAFGFLAGTSLQAEDTTVAPPAATPTTPPAQAESQRLISLVLLLGEPRTLDAAAVAHAVSKALGTEVPEDAITAKPPSFVVKTANGQFAINSVGESYFTDSDKLADEVKLPALGGAIREHRAWLSVDWLEKDDKADLRKVYQQVSQIIAQFVRRDTLAIYSPDTDQFHLNDKTLLGHLRSDDPLHDLVPAGLAAAADSKVTIDDDDPKLQAAQAEAKANWPTFIAAFKARAKDQYFGVKGRILEGDKGEYLWLRVTDIDDTLIHGRLDNDPADLKKVVRGADLHIPIAEVDDWLYTTGAGNEDTKGGYTLRVFDEIAQAKP